MLGRNSHIVIINSISLIMNKSTTFILNVTNPFLQLCRLSRSAHVNGWTVGTLITSLCRFCDMQQEATRGQYETSESLLEHLKHLIDKTPLN